MSVRRYDRATIRADKKNLTPQGFLRADASLARTGVQLYRCADGSNRREYRPPDEVFNKDAIASFHLAPITLLHPPVPVTKDNAEQYIRGCVYQPEKDDNGKHVKATVLITHADAIEAALSGRAAETSAGYECDLDDTPGVSPEGEKYDSIQRNIRANHVALVPQGRAGPEVRLKLDATDAEQIEDEGPPGPAKPKEQSVKTKINGVEYEISAEAAQALDVERKDSATAIAKVEAARDAAKIEVDKQKARADAAEAAKDAAEKARKDAEDPKRVDAIVVARAEILGRGRAVLGREAKLDGKTPLEIKRECLAKLAPELKLDQKSDAYVEALFDHSFAEFEKKNPAALALAGLLQPPAPGSRADEDPNDPRAKMMEAQRKKSREMGQHVDADDEDDE